MQSRIFENGSRLRFFVSLTHPVMFSTFRIHFLSANLERFTNNRTIFDSDKPVVYSKRRHTNRKIDKKNSNNNNNNNGKRKSND